MNGIQEVSGSIPLISTIKVLYLARFRKKTGFFNRKSFAAFERFRVKNEKSLGNQCFQGFQGFKYTSLLVEISGIEPLTS